MAIILFRHIIYNCKKATLLLIKKEHKKISFKERISLSYHLLFCKPCRQFGKQSQFINQSLQYLAEHELQKPAYNLPEISKKKLQSLIDDPA